MSLLLCILSLSKIIYTLIKFGKTVSRGSWRFLIWRLVITWHECALIKVDRLLNVKLAVAMETFQVESCVRGYLSYKVGWSTSLGEVLQCTREFEKHPRIATLSPWYVKALLLAISLARLQLQVPCS